MRGRPARVQLRTASWAGFRGEDRRRTGFSLLELAVALVILEVGVLGVLSLSVLAARELAVAADTQRAVGVAEVVADSLLRHRVRGDGQTRVGLHTVRWSRGHGLLVVEAHRAGSRGEPLARFDLPLEP
jgi:hypothetical protein